MSRLAQRVLQWAAHERFDLRQRFVRVCCYLFGGGDCDGDDSDQYKIADKTTWLKDYKYTSEILECERSLSWPNQLADMLGIECENKARSGNSEFGMIHNYTIDLSNDVFDEDDIVMM